MTSKDLDAETGLYHLGVRSYDPWSGRFIGVDTFASDSTLAPWSPYQYSFDNPIRSKDPTGKWPGFAANLANAFTSWMYNEIHGATSTLFSAMKANYTANFSPSNSAATKAVYERVGPVAMATAPSSISAMQLNVFSDFSYAEGLGAATGAGVAITAGVLSADPLLVPFQLILPNNVQVKLSLE